jgi:glycosyltransferase involved in cell wall biosynthesis
MDVVALPTYREGLPVVPLEAAAMRLPVVATSIPACADAVVDGETGSLVPPRDGRALADALDRYLRNPDLRGSHGREARDRMLRWFRPEAMWEALLGEYQSLLRWRGIAP